MRSAQPRRKMPSRTALCLCALALASMPGCRRTVLVTEDSPLRVGPGTTARVYSLQPDGRWLLSEDQVQVPEGWYLVPPSYVQP